MNDDYNKESVLRVIKKMSSGHASVLLIMTQLVAKVEEKTLVLLDEPESSNPLSEGPLTECKAVTKSNNIQSKIALVSSAIGLTVASGLAYVFAKRRKHY